MKIKCLLSGYARHHRSPVKSTSLYGASLLYLMGYNLIKISVKEAQKALSDKKRLDAFCFAVKIKLMFRSSDLIYTSLNNAAKAMHMTKDKFKRLVADAIEYGYVREERNENGVVRYIARKLYTNRDYSYKLREGDLKDLFMPQLKFLVKRIVVENKINIITEVFNTHQNAEDGKTIKEIRSARKKEVRMLKTDFREDYLGCSYATIMDLTKGTKYQAAKITNYLTERKIVKRIIRLVTIDKNPKDIARSQAYNCADGSLIIESGHTRKAYIKKSNVYFTNKEKSHIAAPTFHEKEPVTK